MGPLPSGVQTFLKEGLFRMDPAGFEPAASPMPRG